MSLRSALLALVAVPALAPCAAGQDAVEVRSPYVGQEDRAIKALSADEVRGLLDGEGLGYALAAELNGWPGPRHVLDLADSLALTDEQRARVGEIHDRMKLSARSLGARVVDAERALDAAFASGSTPPEGIEEKVAAIARLEGKLRAVHLVAHLETRGAMSAAQVARYGELRGYGPDQGGGDHDHGAGHDREG